MREYLEGSFVTEVTTWPLVQQSLNTLDVAAVDAFEVGAFGKELPNEAVGVLVGAAVPGAVRFGEVNREAQVVSQRLMLGELKTNCRR